jgi:hypothetical protein
MKVLVEISSRADIPQKNQDSGYFLVLKPDSYKYLSDYLSSVPDGQMVYLFIWANISLDLFLKILEDYLGGITVYRCSMGDGKDVSLSKAIMSRFNLVLNRKFKNPNIDLEYAGVDYNQKLLDCLRRIS